MLKYSRNFFNQISLKASIHLLWSLSLFISALKNAYYWQFGRLGSDTLYQFPLIDVINYIPQLVFLSFLTVGILSTVFLFSNNNRVKSIPFFMNGFFNLFFQLSDYLALHHDMLLSCILFPLYGLYLISDSNKYRVVNAITAVVCATYLASGIVKANGDFLSGEIVSRLIDRSESYNYFFVLQQFKRFSFILAWFAMLIEITEPFIIIFTTGFVKVVTIIFTFPFHLTILLTKTGTVYNLLYPASFLLIISEMEDKFLENNSMIYKLYKIISLTFILFSCIYIFILLVVSIKEVNPL